MFSETMPECMRTHFFGNFCLTDSLLYCSVDSRLIQMVPTDPDGDGVLFNYEGLLRDPEQEIHIVVF